MKPPPASGTRAGEADRIREVPELERPPPRGRGLGLLPAFALAWLATRALVVISGFEESNPIDSPPLRWTRVTANHPGRSLMAFTCIAWGLFPKKR